MAKLGAILILLLAINSYAKESCHIELPKKILFLKKADKVEQIKDTVIRSTCSKKILWELFSILYEVDGKVYTKHIGQLIQKKGVGGTIKWRPEAIEVFHIRNIISKKVPLDNELKITSVKVIDPIYAMSIEKLSEIQIDCHACNHTGKKNIGVVLSNPINGHRRKIWASVRILQFKEIVIASSDLRPFSKQGLKHNVTLDSLYLEDTTPYVQSIDDLKYYSINKFIKKGLPLKQSDLTPKRLVQTGKLTKVAIYKDRLTLKSEAIAQQAGKYGEFINLYNPRSKKQIRGKVVDFNTVRIDI